VADAVMRMPEPQVLRQAEEEEEEELTQPQLLAKQITPLVQRQDEEEEEETIQTKPISSEITSVIQRQGEPEEEEEEPIQSKLVSDQITPLIQKQAEPEEEQELIQTQTLTAQITPLVQRQAEEEEEPIQAKLASETQVQCQDEEPEEEKEEIQTKSFFHQITHLIQRQEEEEEQEETLQAKPNTSRTPEATHDVESRIQSLRGGGQPLSESSRAFFEPRFGRDFSQVRVHTDSRAYESARKLNAQVFTMGNDIYFNSGRFSPYTSSGRHLLAHELTHVIQQSKTLGNRLFKTRFNVAHQNNDNKRLKDQSLSKIKQRKFLPFIQFKKSISRKKGKNPAAFRLKARKDPKEPRRLIFNKPVKLQEAIYYLWGERYAPKSFWPDPGEKPTSKGRQRSFLWDTKEINAWLNIRAEVKEQYKFEVITARVPPLEKQFPKWVPASIRSQILEMQRAGKFSRELLPVLRHFPGDAPFGEIILWVGVGEFGQTEIQIYQEFPDSLKFYLGVTRGSRRQARLLLESYTQFNRDMRYFVEEKGLSPSEARAELRRIYDEVLKLVIVGAVTLLTSGMNVSAIRLNSQQVISASKRTRPSVGRRIPVRGEARPGVPSKAPPTEARPVKAMPTKMRSPELLPSLKFKGRTGKLVQHAPDWGFGTKGKVPKGAANKVARIAQSIRRRATIIKQGTWGRGAGKVENAIFYSNGKHIVVTKPDGLFVTILKNAMKNKHFQNATTIWTKLRGRGL